MREVILDTETTGLDPLQGHRIVEIGAIELLNHLPTGRSYHTYLNPERDMPKDAEAVHGLSTEFLGDKPAFASVAVEFLDFIADSVLVIHNASFDMGFLNSELARAGHQPLVGERVIDTLQLARRKHPMGPNNLDALCKRYNVDNSKRAKHGALLDAELLAEVYLELIGGRQTSLALVSDAGATLPLNGAGTSLDALARPRPLPPRLTAEEVEAHERLIAELGGRALWKSARK